MISNIQLADLLGITPKQAAILIKKRCPSYTSQKVKTSKSNFRKELYITEEEYNTHFSEDVEKHQTYINHLSVLGSALKEGLGITLFGDWKENVIFKKHTSFDDITPRRMTKNWE